MKIMTFAALGGLMLAVPAYAQSVPSSNATVLGTETTAGNAAGDPSAATPAGQISTTGFGQASPTGIASEARAIPGGPVNQAQSPSADSSTTGTTTR